MPDAEPAVSYSRPSILGGYNWRLHQVAVREARELQRRRCIEYAVNPGCSVAVGEKRWPEGSAISLRTVRDAQLWSEMLDRQVISHVPPSEFPCHGTAPYTHVVIKHSRGRAVGSRVSASDYSTRAGHEADRLMARLVSNGVLRPITPGMESLKKQWVLYPTPPTCEVP